MTADDRAREIVEKHWYRLQGKRADAKAALISEIAAALSALERQDSKRISELEAALKPFAEWATPYDAEKRTGNLSPKHADEFRIQDLMRAAMGEITVGDFRRAYRALLAASQVADHREGE